MRNGIKGFILRGLAAGAAGGAAAALFIRFVTERQISAALKYENATGIGLPPGEPAEFSRGTQHWGGMAAAVIYGLALGVVFGIALAALHHRIRGRNEFDRAWKLALAAFVAVVLIPALKYPPNPPTVGNPDTINQRTTDYLLLLAASVVVVAITFWFWTWLTGRGWDGASRFLVGGGAFVVMVTVLMLVWPPSPDAITPPDSDAAPALQISADAPPDVLAAMLDAARANGDGWIRDPQHPDQAAGPEQRGTRGSRRRAGRGEHHEAGDRDLHHHPVALPHPCHRGPRPHVGGHRRRLRAPRRPAVAGACQSSRGRADGLAGVFLTRRLAPNVLYSGSPSATMEAQARTR